MDRATPGHHAKVQHRWDLWGRQTRSRWTAELTHGSHYSIDESSPQARELDLVRFGALRELRREVRVIAYDDLCSLRSSGLAWRRRRRSPRLDDRRRIVRKIECSQSRDVRSRQVFGIRAPRARSGRSMERSPSYSSSRTVETSSPRMAVRQRRRHEGRDLIGGTTRTRRPNCLRSELGRSPCRCSPL